MHAVPLEARIVSSPADENDKGGPRQHWIDVSFTAAPVALSYIAFHNYYCAPAPSLWSFMLASPEHSS